MYLNIKETQQDYTIQPIKKQKHSLGIIPINLWFGSKQLQASSVWHLLILFITDFQASYVVSDQLFNFYSCMSNQIHLKILPPH